MEINQLDEKSRSAPPLKARTSEGIAYSSMACDPVETLQGGPRSPQLHELAKGRGLGGGEVRWARRTAICGAILVG